MESYYRQHCYYLTDNSHRLIHFREECERCHASTVITKGEVGGLEMDAAQTLEDGGRLALWMQYPLSRQLICLLRLEVHSRVSEGHRFMQRIKC